MVECEIIEYRTSSVRRDELGLGQKRFRIEFHVGLSAIPARDRNLTHDSGTLPQHNDRFSEIPFIALMQAIGPENFNIHRPRISQTKMKAWIIRRVITGLTYPGLRLHFVPTMH